MPVAAESEVASWFSTLAQFESASIDAFEILASELSAHAAPRRLITAALRAANDERRHTRTASWLARRFGAEVTLPKITRPVSARSLVDIAIENAAEGCVRETYGAAVAHWQAETAQDTSVRRAMRTIARDESRHAQLAFEVDAWAKAKLSAKAKRRVQNARDAAREELIASAAHPVARELVTEAGLPDATASKRLLENMRQQFWS